MISTLLDRLAVGSADLTIGTGSTAIDTISELPSTAVGSLAGYIGAFGS